MKSLCEDCNQEKELHAKNMCRICYDNRRLGARIKLNHDLSEKVREFQKEIKWDYHKTILHLIYLGIKNKEKIKELGGKV